MLERLEQGLAESTLQEDTSSTSSVAVVCFDDNFGKALRLLVDGKPIKPLNTVNCLLEAEARRFHGINALKSMIREFLIGNEKQRTMTVSVLQQRLQRFKFKLIHSNSHLCRSLESPGQIQQWQSRSFNS